MNIKFPTGADPMLHLRRQSAAERCDRNNAELGATRPRTIESLDLERTLGTELWLAVEWSLLPNLAVPHITQTFARTGKYFSQGASRQFSAMHVVKELLRTGVQPEQAKSLEAIRSIHEKHGVSPSDLGYTLSTILTGVPRWFERFSSQQMNAAQRLGLVSLVNQIAAASGFTQLGAQADEAGWHEFQTQFERQHRGCCAENQRMYLHMMQVFVDRFPRSARSIAKLVFRCSTPVELFPYLDLLVPNACARLLFAAMIRSRKILGPNHSLNQLIDRVAAGEGSNSVGSLK